jgi:hypothetical protein
MMVRTPLLAMAVDDVETEGPFAAGMPTLASAPRQKKRKNGS